ncbi:Dabb family protein [Nocardioides yefusunii]|uniref:Dabb family protein n=1 Tax=Nocardioides yefusunii TaxID=2500546 RepID=A0ABW1QYX5_9ACTN|nr:Dabb family protein [Nocardioides yefusunii]
MAFNHVGHLTLAADVTDEQVAGIVDGLVALYGQIDGLLSAQVVRDAGLTEGNANVRFHMRFDTQASWEAYRTHPAHVAVVKNHIGPVLGSKAFVQYDDAAVVSSGDLA